MMSESDSLNSRDIRMISFEKIREENHRLKEEVYRLREEAREKDALISTLESQVTALVVDGRESNKEIIHCEEDADYDIESHIDSVEDVCEGSRRTNKVSANVVEKDQDEGNSYRTDVLHDDNSKREGSTCTINRTDLTATSGNVARDASLRLRQTTGFPWLPSSSSVSPSLDPPRRSTVEMKHPPAPIRDLCKRTELVPSTSRRTCFQIGTAAIKALPRELSINNHSNYLNDDDDDRENDIDSDDSEQKQQSEKYEVVNTEFIDAYNSRGIYSGTVQRATQMPHGRGKMIYHKGGNVGGRYYDGDWHVGHWHGYGIIRDAGGDIYEGQVVNDLKEGIGTMQFTDRRIFQGEFRQDEASEGTMSYIDGAQYEGELHHGNRHGFGVYRFSDGSSYEGESVMNLFEGSGKMTWSDGGWYEGDWSRGEIHGFGNEYRPDGSLRHDGRWIKGVPIRTIKSYHHTKQY